MHLGKLSKKETMILSAIVALMNELPNPDLMGYIEAIGQIRREYFGIPNRDYADRRMERPKGYAIQRTIRATRGVKGGLAVRRETR